RAGHRGGGFPYRRGTRRCHGPLGRRFPRGDHGRIRGGHFRGQRFVAISRVAFTVPRRQVVVGRRRGDGGLGRFHRFGGCRGRGRLAGCRRRGDRGNDGGNSGRLSDGGAGLGR